MTRASFLALFAVIAAAGCGSSAKGSLSPADYGRAASQMCIQRQSIVYPDRATAKSKKQLVAIDTAIERNSRSFHRQLEALVPPVSLQLTARRWLATLDAESRVYDRYLEITDGRIPGSRPNGNALERLGLEAQRLARSLGATGCTLQGLGEGYRPYPLPEVEAALRAEGLRYSDPFEHGNTYANGWTASCPETGRPLFAKGWSLSLFQNTNQADAAAACLSKSGRRGRDFLEHGNVVV